MPCEIEMEWDVGYAKFLAQYVSDIILSLYAFHSGMLKYFQKDNKIVMAD